MLRRLLAASLGHRVCWDAGGHGTDVSAGDCCRLQLIVAGPVSGDLKQVSQHELMAVISESLDGGFLTVDLHTIREPEEQLPWVTTRRSAGSGRTAWRQVIEHGTSLTGQSLGRLNHAGEVFGHENVQPLAGLPRLAGPQGSEALVMQQYKLVQEQLEALGLQVKALQMSARGC